MCSKSTNLILAMSLIFEKIFLYMMPWSVSRDIRVN